MQQVLQIILASLIIVPFAANADSVVEIESNDSAATAQNIDGSFDLSFNALIGDAAYVNTSTTIPHAEITGTGDGTYDWYSFTVATAGSQGVFDIDCAWQNQSGECAGSGLITSFDAFIDLFDTDGVTPLRDTNAYSDGYDDGFISFPTGTGRDAGSTGSFGLDPFVTYTFATSGTYYIRVGECCGFTDPTDFTSAVALEPSGDYLLNVSISDPTPTPEILLEQLGTAVIGVGPGNSLADKIMLAQTYLAVPDVQSTCAILSDFLNQVRAQRGKKLTIENADQLTADAQAIMDAIGCN
jgi:hypothetical protein